MSKLRYYARDFFRGWNAETTFGYFGSSAATGVIFVLLVAIIL